jgi:cytochrome P450
VTLLRRVSSFLARKLAQPGDGAGHIDYRRRSVVRSAEFDADPHSLYRELRKTGNLHFLPEENAWLVIGYDAANLMLRQPSVFSSSPFASQSPSLHGADAPQHTKMRRLLSPYFTRERQQLQRESMRRHSAIALTRVRGMRAFDAVADLAVPVPFGVACDWLGLDEPKATAIHRLPIAEVTWDMVAPSIRDDGLIAELVATDELPPAQVAELAAFLLAASYGSTRDFFLLSLSVLLAQPDIVSAVLSNKTLLPALIEELLRFEPSVHTLVRRAKSDTTVEGATIREGSIIWISIAAANRDPAVFDDPDEMRLNRNPNRHLTFGMGPHFCLGSPAARMESEVLLDAILPEIPNLVSNGPMVVEFAQGFAAGAPSLRQVRSWPLRFCA